MNQITCDLLVLFFGIFLFGMYISPIETLKIFIAGILGLTVTIPFVLLIGSYVVGGKIIDYF